MIRGGSREADVNEINAKWVPHNRLMAARDYRRINTLGCPDVLGDANIMNNGPAFAPMIPGMVDNEISPMIPRMVRKPGETTLDTRARGNADMWAGTPAAPIVPATVGDASIDITDAIKNVQSVGFEWDFKENYLKVYILTGGKEYEVKIPGKVILNIFNHVNGADVFNAERLDMLFHQLVLHRKKKAQQAKLGGFFDDVSGFFSGAAKEVGKVASSVARVATDVVASNEWKAVSAAVSVIPVVGPVVGGAGLAVGTAASLAKPFINKALDEFDKATKGGDKKPDVKAIVKKAVSTAKPAAKQLVNMAMNATNDPKGLMAAALKSNPAKPAPLAGKAIRVNPKANSAKVVAAPKPSAKPVAKPVAKPNVKAITYGCTCIDKKCSCKKGK